MAYDSIEIILKAILAKTSEAELTTQLRALEKKLPKLNVHADYSKYFDDYEKFWLKSIKTMEEKQKKSDNDREQNWLKNLKNREIAEQKANERNESNRVKQEQEYERFWQMSLKEKEISQAKIDAKAIENKKKETQEIEKHLSLYKEELAIKNRDLKTSYGKSYDSAGMGAVLNSANKLNANDFTSLSSAKDATKQIDLQYSKTLSGMKELRKETTLLRKETDGFATTFIKDLGKLTIWSLSATALFLPLRQLKESIQYISELDNALNEIRIVTGKSNADVNQLAQSYNNLAKQMSVSTKEVAGTAVDLYRQGLQGDDVTERMQAIIKYAKISSLSLSDSNKIITATMNATGESAQKVIDTFSYLGDATASGADEIGTAMQKVASMNDGIGVSMSKAASWISVISSKTREGASQIGTSLKSIESRYTSIKEKGFNAEDATDINQVTKALTTAGVQATTSNGQLRNFAEVIDDLGKRYSTLDDKTKNYVMTTLGGTYQMNRLRALMEGYSQSIDLYNNSLTKTGIANQKFNIWQESTQAKMEKLKASWEGFAQATIDSGMIKGTLDNLTYLSNVLGNMPTLISLVVTGFALWKGMSIAKFLTDTSFSLSGLIAGIRVYLVQQAMAIGVTEEAATAMGTLKLAFMTNPFGLIAVAITSAIVAFNIFNQAQEELIQKTKEAGNKAREESESLTVLLSKMNELISLENKDESAKQQLKSVQEQLIKTLGLEKQGIDLVNDSRGESIKKIREEAIEKLKSNENALIAAKNNAENAKKNQGGSSSSFGMSGYEFAGAPALDSNDSKAFNLLKSVQGLRTDSSGLGTWIMMANASVTAEEKVKILESALNKLKEAGLDNTSVFNQLTASQSGYNKVITDAKSAQNAYNENKANQIILEKNTQIEIPKTEESFNNYKKSILDSIQGNEEFKKVLSDLIDKQFPQFSQGADKAKDSINGLKDSLSLEDAISKAKELGQFIKDISDKRGGLSPDHISKIIKDYPELIQYMGDEKRLLDELKKKQVEYEDVALKATRDTYRAKLETSESFFNESIKGNQQLWNQVKNAYGTDAENFKKVADVKKKTNDILIRAIGADWANFYKSDVEALKSVRADLARRNADGSKTAQVEGLSTQIGVLEALNKPIDLKLNDIKLNFDYGNIGTKSPKESSGGATDKAPDPLKLEIDRYTELNSALEDVNNQLERNNTLEEQSTSLSDKNKILADRIELLKKQKLAQNDIEWAQKQERLGLSQKLSSKDYGFTVSGGFDEANTVSNYPSRLKAMYDNLNAYGNQKGYNHDVYADKLAQIKEVENSYKRILELNKLIPEEQNKQLKVETDIAKVTENIRKNDFDAYLNASETAYGKTKDITKYINDLQWGLANLNLTEKERLDLINKINEAQKKQQEDIDKILKAYNNGLIEVENEQIESIKKLQSTEKDRHETRINQLETEKQALQYRNSEQEKANQLADKEMEITKKQQELDNLKSNEENYVKVYQNGAWSKQVDSRKVKTIQDDLDKLNKDKQDILDKQKQEQEIHGLENQINKEKRLKEQTDKRYEDEIKWHQSRIDDLKDEKKLADDVTMSFETAIKSLGIYGDAGKKAIEDLREKQTIANAKTTTINDGKDVYMTKSLDLNGTKVDAYYKNGKLTGVKSYDVGTQFVEKDQLALVHKGEAVIPAAFNPFNFMNKLQTFIPRVQPAMAGASGDSFTIHGDVKVYTDNIGGIMNGIKKKVTGGA